MISGYGSKVMRLLGGVLLVVVVIWGIMNLQEVGEIENTVLTVTRVVATPTSMVARMTATATVGVEATGTGTAVPPTPVPEITPAIEPEETVAEEIVLNISFEKGPAIFDPALATEPFEVDVVNNLFMSLTEIEPETGAVLPSLATHWEANETGDVYTFWLRDDVPWVVYDMEAEEVVRVRDEEGEVRYVTAEDVAYGVKRTLSPATGSRYGMLATVIAHGETFYNSGAGAAEDKLGIRVVDEHTIQFELREPAAYFPATAASWVMSPVPSWAIEEWGERWVEAGLLVSNGPYSLANWLYGQRLELVKNPWWVGAEAVQIERIKGRAVADEGAALVAYQELLVDTIRPAVADLDEIAAQPMLARDQAVAGDNCSYFLGFNQNLYPFDDVRVRYALAAAVDREWIVTEVLKRGEPAFSLVPPGAWGSLSGLGDVDPKMGYEPEGARASLQAYLDEMGMSIEGFNGLNIRFMHNTGEGHRQVAEVVQRMWAETLGVTVTLEVVDWSTYLKRLSGGTETEDEAHVWRLGWCGDVPDADSWLTAVFHAEDGLNWGGRAYGEFDELLERARGEVDLEARREMYGEAEYLLAVEEAAYIPVYHYGHVYLARPWLERTYRPWGGEAYYEWVVDMEGKWAYGDG
ncbi:MAG TPA: peptide ABC transporter substrate-binding protein [Anaerolineae bacterium]|nr:peptide ABC transporter substrate-binding protein [Anaerolineae bacterium]